MELYHKTRSFDLIHPHSPIKLDTMKLLKSFSFASLLAASLITSCKDSVSEEKTDLSISDSSCKIHKDEICTSSNTASELNAKEPSSVVKQEEKINSVARLNKRLSKKASYFVIQNNKDTVIQCKEGTLLSIPANAFQYCSTQLPVNGPVKISVKEFYKISDMLIAGLTTKSNDQLLESGGMICIKVSSKVNNDSCILSPGKNISIAMPNSLTTNVDGMRLFNGKHDSASLNWVPRTGVPGMAQRWSMNYFSNGGYELDLGMAFLDEKSKLKPVMINSNPEKLKAEIKVPLRELIRGSGPITRKVSAFIDTSGNLHCYEIEHNNEPILFNEIYKPISDQNTKVNVAVDVSLRYQARLNNAYYQKLFKMGKCNPDSLIVVTATLNPIAKRTGNKKVKKNLHKVVTVKEFNSKQRLQAKINEEFDKKLKQLRLANEERLVNSVGKGAADLRSAQNYLLLNTTKLGWINCDKFNQSPNNVEYFVKLDEPASVLIVFKDMKSILTCNAHGSFGKAPLNEKITVVGLKTSKGKLMMALHETTITKQAFEKLNFEPVSVHEYKNKLEKLNTL